MTWALTVAGAVLGILLGWLLRGDRTEGDTVRDWETRLAARDEDLQAAQEELANAVLQLQELHTAVHRNGEGSGSAADGAELAEARRALLELGKELESTRRALAESDQACAQLDAARTETATLQERIAILEQQANPAGNDARVEALEVELATLESMRCPDPASHRRDGGDRQAHAADPDPPDRPDGHNDDRTSRARAGNGGSDGTDDLTSIRGIGSGLARILKTLGITTYRSLAEIDTDSVARLTELLDGAPVDVNPDHWAAAARSEHLRKYGVEL